MSETVNTKVSSFKSARHALGLLLIVPTLLLVGCVSITTDGGNGEAATEEDQKHSFVVSDNPTIDVSGFNGSIEIIPGDTGEVDVEATLKIPSRINYSVEQTGNTVTVVAKRTGSGITFGRSPSVDMRLTVPALSTIKARTSNGQVIVDGITGDGTVDTSNGRITLTNVDGTFITSTSNGSVKMVGVTGQFSAETSNGRIEFSGVFDDGSNNNFSTSNGSIDIAFAVNEPSVALDARTSNGTVDSERPILATTTQKSRLVGKYGEGSANLVVRTSNGSIAIR